MALEIGLLGPMTACRDGHQIPLGSPKQQALLGVLLLYPHRTLTRQQLIAELWDGMAPYSAVPNLRTYVTRLRQVLAGDARITSKAGRYALNLHHVHLDIDGLRQRAEQASREKAAGDHIAAAATLESALAMCRGEPLAGVPAGPLLTAARHRLVSQWLVVAEDFYATRLAAGEDLTLVGPLREHLALHPVHEAAWVLLVEALYRGGDSAGALAAVIDARSALRDRLGIEPGDQLQRLQQDILHRRPPTGTRNHPRPVPRQLPPDQPAFTGRRPELDVLVDVLAHPPAVVSIHGSPGVGKSALAVHAVHRLANRYPDGQLYIDLLGATPGARPLSPEEALRQLLHAFGAGDSIPPAIGAASALFRSHTASRRMVVILDNAADSAQVRPLLLAGDGCATVVTSRRALLLPGLRLQLNLDRLGEEEALQMLQAVADRRDDLATAEATDLVRLCDRLPLALWIAATRLADRTDMGVGDIAARLADEQRRLDELRYDDVAVRSSIALSYASIAESPIAANRLAARAFPVLGRLRLLDFGPSLVAAALGVSSRASDEAVDSLVAAHLVTPRGSGRYQMHDLVRLYAAELALDGNDEAVHSVFRYLFATACRAGELLRPGRQQLPASSFLGSTGTEAEPLSGPAEAARWLGVERANLLALAEQAAEHAGELASFGRYVYQAITGYLVKRHDWTTERRLSEISLQVARRDGDLTGEAHSLVSLGRFNAYAGRFEEALRLQDEAVAIAQRLDDRRFAAIVQNNLGLTRLFAGEYASAAGHFHAALALARAAQEPVSRAARGIFLLNLANAYAGLGKWTTARQHLCRSLDQRRALGDLAGEAVTLVALGLVLTALGQLADGEHYLDDGLARCRSTGNITDEVHALIGRCGLRLRQGSADTAKAAANQALELAVRSGYLAGEAVALRMLAQVAYAASIDADARQYAAASASCYARLGPVHEVMLESFVDTVTASASGRPVPSTVSVPLRGGSASVPRQ